MADGQSVKGYEQRMAPLPEGVAAQPSAAAPRPFAQNYDRNSPEGQALTNPHPTDLELGKKMYDIYCTPCHGDGEVLGPVAQPGRFPGVVPLSGPGGVARARTDGWIYLTIRNGGAVMPNYGFTMSDAEMWAVVDYVRTLPNARNPSQPPAR
jgi:mono/diheme cytochrome c family protein